MDLECAGCGQAVPEGEEGPVWIDTPLGICCAKTHRDQECARRAVANHREQPAKRIHPPKTREERGQERLGV